MTLLPENNFCNDSDVAVSGLSRQRQPLPTQVCVLGVPGKSKDASALLQPLNVEAREGSDGPAGAEDESSVSSAGEPEAEQVKRKRGRKAKTAQAAPKLGDVAWLATALNELSSEAQPQEDGQTNTDAGADAVGDKSVHSSHSTSASSAGKAGLGHADASSFVGDLLTDAFELPRQSSSFGRTVLDDMEANEERYAEEMEKESGIEEMAEREAKVIEQAIKIAAKMESDGKKHKSPVSEAHIHETISEFIARGFDAEDAGQEAMLNHADLLGNEGFPAAAAPASNVHTDNRENSLHAESTKSLQGLGVDFDGVAKTFLPPGFRDAKVSFSDWSAECVISLEALRSRSQAVLEKKVGQGNELSLVLGSIEGSSSSASILPPDHATGTDEADNQLAEQADANENSNVFLVHWKTAGEYGRPASLDKENRVKCIVPTGALREPRDYRNAKIIWPAIGISMQRARGWKGMLRPQVPPAVMRVYQMWQQALLAGARAMESLQSEEPLARYSKTIPSDQNCLACKRNLPIRALEFPCTLRSSFNAPSSSANDLDYEHEYDNVRVCPLCLQPLHWVCATILARNGSESGFTFPDELVCSLEKPDVFDAGLGTSLGLDYWVSYTLTGSDYCMGAEHY